MLLPVLGFLGFFFFRLMKMKQQMILFIFKTLSNSIYQLSEILNKYG